MSNNKNWLLTPQGRKTLSEGDIVSFPGKKAAPASKSAFDDDQGEAYDKHMVKYEGKHPVDVAHQKALDHLYAAAKAVHEVHELTKKYGIDADLAQVRKQHGNSYDHVIKAINGIDDSKIDASGAIFKKDNSKK